MEGAMVKLLFLVVVATLSLPAVIDAILDYDFQPADSFFGVVDENTRPRPPPSFRLNSRILATKSKSPPPPPKAKTVKPPPPPPKIKKVKSPPPPKIRKSPPPPKIKKSPPPPKIKKSPPPPKIKKSPPPPKIKKSPPPPKIKKSPPPPKIKKSPPPPKIKKSPPPPKIKKSPPPPKRKSPPPPKPKSPPPPKPKSPPPPVPKSPPPVPKSPPPVPKSPPPVPKSPPPVPKSPPPAPPRYPPPPVLSPPPKSPPPPASSPPPPPKSPPPPASSPPPPKSPPPPASSPPPPKSPPPPASSPPPPKSPPPPASSPPPPKSPPPPASSPPPPKSPPPPASSPPPPKSPPPPASSPPPPPKPANRNTTRWEVNYMNNWTPKDPPGGLVLSEDQYHVDMMITSESQIFGNFLSQKRYLFGYFDIWMKLIPNDSAGIIMTYYFTSPENHTYDASGNDLDRHDEIDFEFLGNSTGEPITLQTNVYLEGKGNREQRHYLPFDPSADFHKYSLLWNEHMIVWYVDDSVIRVHYNKGGVPYPTWRPMAVEASLWNGSSWATQGGAVKLNISNQPFVVSYEGFDGIDGCAVCQTNVWSDPSPDCLMSPNNGWTQQCAGNGKWWNQQTELTPTQIQQLKAHEQTYIIYNYCYDYNRFGGVDKIPKECQYNEYT